MKKMNTADLLKETKISFFGNCTYTKPYKDITLLDWLTYYSKSNISKIDEIRQAAAAGDDTTKKMINRSEYAGIRMVERVSRRKRGR